MTRERIVGKYRIVSDFYKTGELLRECYYYNGEIHREDGPAIIEYSADGEVLTYKYYTNNKLNREDGPAIIERSFSGMLSTEVYYTNGVINRSNGPAYIYYSEDHDKCYKNTEKYYTNGNIYRANNKPAIVMYFSNGNIFVEQYYNQNGVLDRYNGPACIRYTNDGNISSVDYYYKGVEFKHNKLIKDRINKKRIKMTRKIENLILLYFSLIHYKDQYDNYDELTNLIDARLILEIL